jgi:hypothetical protein
MRPFHVVPVAALVATSAAAVPLQITHQARLTNAAGAPVDGAVTVEARLFDAATTGNQLWFDDFAATAVDGYVSVLLGSETALPSSVFDRPEVWLQVSAGGTTLAPRTRVVAVPYAMRADVAEGVEIDASPAVEPCTSGAMVYDTSFQALRVCVGSAWRILRSDPMPAGPYGDGASGAATFAGTFNVNTDSTPGRSQPDGVAYKVTADPVSTTISVSGTAGFAPGDLALLINLQGSSANNADVGNYEIVEITGAGSGTLTLAATPTLSYDSNSFATQKVAIQRIPQYTNVTINGTVTASAWGDLADIGGGKVATGIVAMAASGTFTIASGGTIDARYLGFKGGTSTTYTGPCQQGETYSGDGGQTTARNNGGGGGGQHTSGQHSGGGGGGAYGGVGENGFCDNAPGCGVAGAVYGDAPLARFYLGSGGGGGSEQGSGGTPAPTNGRGGHGGGAVMLLAQTLTVTGTIQADGEQGKSQGGSTDGGGGGSGGSVYVKVETGALGTTRITANGGARSAGNAGGGNSAGGAAGVGRVAVYYDTTFTGTTAPAAFSAGF